MTRRQSRAGKAAGRIAWSAVAAVAVALWVPTAAASPETDAQDAINAAWQAAGGDTSALGPPEGDVYPVGAGFARDFAGGKMFFTPDTGARALHGAILGEYEALGGAADSGLGFPNIDEVAGLVSPESRLVTFSAGDNPVIFWTPDHGAHVVRGPINAAWDKLGSSTSPVGVPVDDESYDRGVVSQKFSAGQLSFNSQTRAFTTVPPGLAEQLADLPAQPDPTAAINDAWRAAGGASGRLGARKGDQYTVGSDGAGQDFAGGKIFFSPATGPGALEGDVLAKYESLGGPAGSDLGLPLGNESDGGLPGSRVSTFSGTEAGDEPVIFSTPGTGAFVVRGAMKAAWDKLAGASGKLGAPVGDQTVEGDVVSQKFTGGTVSWNRATNKFSTEPAELAKMLSGVRVPGLNNPATSSTAAGHGGTTLPWHWWWLAIGVGVLAAAGLLAWLGRWWRRRGAARRTPSTTAAREDHRGDDDVDDDDDFDDFDEDFDDEEQWSPTHTEPEASVRLPSRFSERQGATAEAAGPGDTASQLSWTSLETGGQSDPDAVDTAPTRVPTEAELEGGRHTAVDHSQDAAGEQPHPVRSGPAGHPVMHLPLDDPYQSPAGYPVKANIGSGLYYTPDSVLYDDTLAEVWFASEEAAQLNGFVKAR